MNLRSGPIVQHSGVADRRLTACMTVAMTTCMAVAPIQTTQGLTLSIWWLLCGPLLSHGVRLSHHWWRVGGRGCTREGMEKGHIDYCSKTESDGSARAVHFVCSPIKTCIYVCTRCDKGTQARSADSVPTHHHKCDQPPSGSDSIIFLPSSCILG